MWGRGQNLRRLLVIAELALSVMLLIGAGLLVRSFWRLQQVSPGFNADRVLTLELTMTGPRYADSERVLATYRDLWSRLSAIPGANGAGGVSMLPLSQMFAWGPIVARRPRAAVGRNLRERRSARRRRPSTSTRCRFHCLQGRLFNEHDTQGRAARRRHRRSHGAGAVARTRIRSASDCVAAAWTLPTTRRG